MGSLRRARPFGSNGHEVRDRLRAGRGELDRVILQGDLHAIPGAARFLGIDVNTHARGQSKKSYRSASHVQQSLVNQHSRRLLAIAAGDWRELSD